MTEKMLRRLSIGLKGTDEEAAVGDRAQSSSMAQMAVVRTQIETTDASGRRRIRPAVFSSQGATSTSFSIPPPLPDSGITSDSRNTSKCSTRSTPLCESEGKLGKRNYKVSDSLSSEKLTRKTGNSEEIPRPTHVDDATHVKFVSVPSPSSVISTWSANPWVALSDQPAITSVGKCLSMYCQQKLMIASICNSFPSADSKIPRKCEPGSGTEDEMIEKVDHSFPAAGFDVAALKSKGTDILCSVLVTKKGAEKLTGHLTDAILPAPDANAAQPGCHGAKESDSMAHEMVRHDASKTRRYLVQECAGQKKGSGSRSGKKSGSNSQGTAGSKKVGASGQVSTNRTTLSGGGCIGGDDGNDSDDEWSGFNPFRNECGTFDSDDEDKIEEMVWADMDDAPPSPSKSDPSKNGNMVIFMVPGGIDSWRFNRCLLHAQ